MSKHKRFGIISVHFDEDAIHTHFHTPDDYIEGGKKFTMDFHHIWNLHKQTLGGPEHDWKLRGERDELEALLEKMLHPYYIDSLIARFVNSGLAHYE